MTESEYVLTYFNYRARGEVIRLLFVVAGQKYEDQCIDRSEWPAIKTKTPFGQLPTLTVDGVTITQSSAIARFLAKRFGLAGKTDLDCALIDSYVDQMGDVTAHLRNAYHAKDDAAKDDVAKEEGKEGVAKELKRVFTEFNECLANSEYLVGGELSWADLTLMNWLDILPYFAPVLLEDYPNVKAHFERVREIPSIKQWIDTRPVTDY